MGFSEDDIEDRAVEIFKRERPSDIWSIQSLPNRAGQDVSASVGIEIRKKYREQARLELEAEGDS